MEAIDLQSIIDGETALTPELLLRLHSEYPYWIWPDVRYLEAEGSGLDENEIRKLKSRIAAAVGNADVLERLALDDDETLYDSEFYPSARPATNTDDVIDGFLNKYGTPPPVPGADPFASATPPPMDITEFVESAVPASEIETSDDDRLWTPSAEKTEQKPALTESFAMYMVKTGQYEKALEIIKDLSLNNPKKSIYFADQMRFLRKLIINKNRYK